MITAFSKQSKIHCDPSYTTEFRQPTKYYVKCPGETQPVRVIKHPMFSALDVLELPENSGRFETALATHLSRGTDLTVVLSDTLA